MADMSARFAMVIDILTVVIVISIINIIIIFFFFFFFVVVVTAISSSSVKVGKLSSVEDGGQTNRVTALPRPYALDIDL